MKQTVKRKENGQQLRRRLNIHRAVRTQSPMDFTPIDKSMMSTDCWLCPYIIDKLIIKVAAFKDLGQQHNTITMSIEDFYNL